jgi:hypothetical protein
MQLSSDYLLGYAQELLVMMLTHRAMRRSPPTQRRAKPNPEEKSRDAVTTAYKLSWYYRARDAP